MNWIELTQDEQLESIVEESKQHPVLIFKHSTRCSISITMLARLERTWNQEETKQCKTYYLDLLAYRPISNRIAELFRVEHQSPQVLLIKDGKCAFTTSHSGIQFQPIAQACLS